MKDVIVKLSILAFAVVFCSIVATCLYPFLLTLAVMIDILFNSICLILSFKM